MQLLFIDQQWELILHRKSHYDCHFAYKKDCFPVMSFTIDYEIYYACKLPNCDSMPKQCAKQCNLLFGRHKSLKLNLSK